LEAAMATFEERANREAARALRKHWKKVGKAPSPAAPPRAKPQPLSRPDEEFFKKISIYTREKNKAGKWRYRGVKAGPGHKHSDLDGPFYLRYSVDGRQTYSTGYPTLDEAREAGQKLKTALEAKAKGLTVPELDELSNANRTPIKRTIDEFLELKRGKAAKTRVAYRLHLDQFIESLKNKIRFMDEITADTLRGYNKFMEANGLSGKTRHNRLMTVFFLLKKNDMKNPFPWDEMPTIEEEPAVAYSSDELDKLFAEMNAGEKLRYNFFLGSGCRDKEVTYASWKDLDFERGTYHVRRKEDVGFNPKSHESREVPLPTDLLTMLREAKKKPTHPGWIFVNDDGRPDNHLLRKLKRIALRAGLNCGHCKSIVTKGKGDNKREVEVSCKTDPVCEHWYLHRLRKTCATRWQENGIPVRTIQTWLAHKNLETTMLYLGVTDVEKLRGEIDRAARVR
jgi:integrase/recombinase XerD